MNPRLAAVLLIGFIALLIFIYVMYTARMKRKNELLSAQRDRIGQYADRVVRYQALIDKIQEIAGASTDVDPSAELTLMEINRFKQKELL